MATNTVTTTSEESLEKVNFFRDRYQAQGYGDGHFVFACQAAFPIAFTPDLLYQLWANFSEYRTAEGHQTKSDLMAISDLLLSNLCQRIERDVFEMDEEVRAYLLQELRSMPYVEQDRMYQIATFLLQYTQSTTMEAYPKSYREAQYWTALVTIAPQKAAQEISAALSQHIRQDQQSDILRMRNLLESFSNLDQRFEGLLYYSKGLKAAMYQMPTQVVQDQFDQAKVLSLTDSAEPGEGVLQLPMLAKLKGQIRLKSWDEDQLPEELIRIQRAQEEQAEELDLSGLGLTDLPDELFELTQLKHVDLSDNSLDSLPRAIQNLIRLETLTIDNNQLEALPSALPTKTLQLLSLADNRIERIIARQIEAFPDSMKLVLRGNPIGDYGIIAAAEKGVGVLKAYLLPPIILLIFGEDSSKYLSNLREKSRRIYQTLIGRQDRGDIEIYREEAATSADIFNVLQRMHNRVAVYHFSGQDSEVLNLEGTKITEGLFGLLSREQNLKLVFLNANLSEEHIQSFLSSGIPALITSQEVVSDRVDVEFPTRFYEELARGETIGHAFKMAEAYILTNIKQSEAPYRLYVSQDWIKDWKLPQRIEDEDSGIQWNASGKYNFDQWPPTDHLVQELIEVLGEQDRTFADLRKRQEVDARLLRRTIVDRFPAIIGEPLRNLLALSDFGTFQHLESLSNIYTALTRYLTTILIAQLWEFKLHRSELSPSRFLQQLIRQFVRPSNREEASSTDQVELSRVILDLFDIHGLMGQALVAEWPIFHEALKTNSDLQRAMKVLSELQPLIYQRSISREEIESLCVQAEIHLAVFMGRTAFIIHYPLLSVKDVEVVEPLFEKAQFRHQVVSLDKITAGYTDQLLESSNFTDTRSVILLKNKGQFEEYLSLSPFLVDERALQGRSGSSLHFVVWSATDLFFWDAVGKSLPYQELQEQKYTFEQLIIEND